MPDVGNRFSRLIPGLTGCRRAVLVLLALLQLGACSAHRTLYPKLLALSGQGQYEEALAVIEEKKGEYGERNAVLFLMDKGLLLHYAGQYEESNKMLEEAERIIDDLYTESVSGNVGAFLSNDNTLPYRGEDFEGVTVNIIRALNYAGLGNVESALVEARKVDQKLGMINRSYPENQRNVYKEDAFARLLMGIFYEVSGTRDDLNDAYISLKKAADTYEKDFLINYGVAAPGVLQANLITTAGFMGKEELSEAKKRYPEVQALSLAEKRGKARLIFVHFAGRAPVKVEDSITGQMMDGNLIRVAFPRYVRRPYNIRGSRIMVDGDPLEPLEPAHPLGDIAIENLNNRKGRIAAKAIARATTKYLANKALQRRAQKKGDAGSILAFLAGNVYAVASEQADLRSWELLPDRMLLGSHLVSPGNHRIIAQFLDSSGGVMATRDLGEISLEAGQTRFFLLHSNH